jgi:hypothetical protein
MADDLEMLVMGESNACFEIVRDLGARPAIMRRGGRCRKRQRLLRAAIEFIHRQHGSGSPWACYVAPAGAFERFDACGGAGETYERQSRPM